nr:hypothetical protein [Tanacetum cinerariifolium]
MNSFIIVSRIHLTNLNGLRRLFQLKKIDNDIYSTVDACPNACEMWKAIKILKKGESINVQDLETNLYWEFGKFTSWDGESLESYYSRFVTLVKQSPELKTVSYHKLYDILKQHQNEVNEIRAKRLAHTANPLALVAQQQPVYHPHNHPNYYTQNSSTRSQQAATKNRGKAIVNSPPPTYDQEPTMVIEDDEISKEKKIEKLMALISLSLNTNNNLNLRTSLNTSRAHQYNTPRINRGTVYDNQRVVNVARARENIGTQMMQWSRIQCYNCKEYRHVVMECQKPKRAKDAAYHKEKMLLCMQEEAGFQLNVEQVDWRDDTNDEHDDQELEAHYMYMAQIQEVTPDVADNSRPIFDTEPLQKVKINDDDYNVFANDRERPKQPESFNDTYLEEQRDTNIIIEPLDMSTNRETDLKKFQTELDRYRDVNYASKVKIDCAKAKGDLMSYKMESQKSLNEHTQKINDLNQTISEMKKELFAHQETISIMSQEKEAHNKFYKTREDKELEKVIALENKIKVVDDIVYKTGQSVQTMNMLNHNCKTSFVKPELLTQSQRANPRLYDICCYNDNLALMLAPESDEMIRLAHEKEMIADLKYFNSLEHEVDSLKSQLKTQITQFLNEIDRLFREYYYADHMNDIHGMYTNLDEFTSLQCDYVDQVIKCECLEKELSKRNTTSKSFKALQQHVTDLELALQQCQEQIKNDKAFKENQSKDLKAQLQDKGIVISELKKLIEKIKGKYVDTKFEKSSVIRQPNVVKSQRPSVLGKPTTFSNSFVRKDFSKSMSVTQTHVLNDFSKPVTAQTLPPNKKSILKNTNMLAPRMYKLHTDHTRTRTSQLPQDSRKTNKRVSFSTGVILTTSVSRPQLKSNPQGDRVMHNNSQGKKPEVKDHCRSVKLSKNKTSVTACNDSLNAMTLHVKSASAMCDKCMLIDKHDMCVLKSVDKPCKETVASESIKKPRNFTRKLYERVSKTCSWWYPKFTPSDTYGNLSLKKKILI